MYHHASAIDKLTTMECVQWEAVEAKIWKQAAATALQKIHEQVRAHHTSA